MATNHAAPENSKGREFLLDGDTTFLNGKTVLITGATGSFGKKFVQRLLHSPVRKVVIFSRDELKQSEMQAHISDPAKRLRFFLGDVRDKERLYRAFAGVNFVVHAAALKQVPTLEYNPFEAVLTNIIGTQNVINAALDQGVERIIGISTDKAANPINLYGATKLCAEKLLVAGNSYSGARPTRFSVVRYGNVVGSRGSVVPLFLAKRSEGVLPITDPRMTRFWITLDQGVNFVLNCLREMTGGEIFVPKIASMRIVDLAKSLAPNCELNVVGMRPGEKLHETLVTDEEAARTLDMGSYFSIQPNFHYHEINRPPGGKPVPANFQLSSETNEAWLTPIELESMVEGTK